VPTRALEPDLAAAYVHELSADVRGVVVLGPDGERLAGPEAMAGPARALAAEIDGDAILRLPGGMVWLTRGQGRTLIAAAGPAAQAGPTFLDARAAIGAAPPTSIPRPVEARSAAASDVLSAT
jgi:hypothetical protein